MRKHQTNARHRTAAASIVRASPNELRIAQQLLANPRAASLFVNKKVSVSGPSGGSGGGGGKAAATAAISGSRVLL